MDIPFKYLGSCLITGILLVLGTSVVHGQYTGDITIGEALSQDSNFSILVDALKAANLFDDLQDPEREFTLFAISNSVVEAALSNAGMTVDALLSDTETLGQSLQYLIIERAIPVDDLPAETELQTMSGDTITVSTDDAGDPWLNGQVRVADANFTGSNGVIYVIESILVPPVSGCTVSAQSRVSTRVRVGPGSNRTAVAFLPLNTDFVVQGKAEDQDGKSWYRLDKSLAAPRKIILEAWVTAAEVTASGDCENVGEVPPPLLIPFPTGTPAS